MNWDPLIRQSIQKILLSTSGKKIAVFDADGTLWNEDVGESFFKYQIKHKLAEPLLKIPDPWQHYKELEAKNTVAAYGWLAQIQKGYKEEDLRSVCQRFYEEEFQGKVFPLMKDLLGEMRSEGFEIWICSASTRWPLEPILPELCVMPENLIAVETVVDPSGIITDKVVPPLPYGHGKKSALSILLKDKPLFVAGNSRGDLEMLGMAKELSLVIGYEPQRDAVKNSELNLREVANANKWPIQIFQTELTI